MPAPTSLAVSPDLTSAVRHEEFCQPTGERDFVRMEQYPHLRDNEAGRSYVSHTVTRCLECGATNYREVRHG